MEKNERFALDNTNHIIDFEDKQDKYCLEYEEVVKLLNNFNKQSKLLKEIYTVLYDLYNDCVSDYEDCLTEEYETMLQIHKKGAKN